VVEVYIEPETNDTRMPEEIEEDAIDLVQDHYLSQLGDYVYRRGQLDFNPIVSEWRGFESEVVLPVADIPEDMHAPQVICDYTLWQTRIWTGGSFIDNPDYSGRVRDLLGPDDDGWLIIVWYHV
jgi:hypothetical protein